MARVIWPMAASSSTGCPFPGAPFLVTTTSATTHGRARRAVSQRRDDQRIALITHKPVTAADAELGAAPAYRFWPQSAWYRVRGCPPRGRFRPTARNPCSDRNAAGS